MKTSVVVGLQWGDEGKGKVVQYLSKVHKWVVRFSGGPNAGHTIYYADKKFVHHLVPSGDEKNFLFIARGTLIDLGILEKEVEELREIFDVKLYISPWCRVITAVDKELDEKIEKLKGPLAVGTTKRGIGPTVANDAHRMALRLFDFFDEEKVSQKMHLLKSVTSVEVNVEKVVEELLTHFYRLQRFVKEPSIDDDVLFEATQAVLLDPFYGTYPYVTSTACVPSTIAYSSGVNFEKMDVYGVFKAYTTRVGSGPFPTELFGEPAEELRKAGNEFGATTGRPRRCGWLDLPLLKYACDIANVDHLVMTKADVLNGFEKVGVCTSYEREDFSVYDLERTNAKIEYMAGWENLKDKNFEDFLSVIEDTLHRKVEMVSYGPQANEIFQR